MIQSTFDHSTSRRRLLQMAGAAGLAVPAAASGLLYIDAVAAQDGESGGEIIVGLDWEPDNLDPAVTPYAVSHWVMMNIYDTLVWRGTDGTFYPGLAETWEVNEEGTVYTFTLKEGVTFHDGTPFNAEAVKFAFDHIVDPETLSGFASSLLGPYDMTEVIDEYTAAVHFTAPYAPFLDSASQAFLAIPSPTAVQADREAYLRNPVGTGFMKFVEWVPEQSHRARAQRRLQLGFAGFRPYRSGVSRQDHLPLLSGQSDSPGRARSRRCESRPGSVAQRDSAPE